MCTTINMDVKCSICQEYLHTSTIARATCCGNGIHQACRDLMLVSSMSERQKQRCPLCRAPYPTPEEATAQLHKKVKLGKAWAQTMLGQNYHRSGKLRQAKRLWELAAGQGDADAQNKLGFMHERGQGVKQSQERAAAYYRAAAAQGHFEAQRNMALLGWN